MAYERLLCAALILFIFLLSNLSKMALLLLGAVACDGRQGSFAAFGFCVSPVWAANVPCREGMGARACAELSVLYFNFSNVLSNQSSRLEIHL